MNLNTFLQKKQQELARAKKLLKRKAFLLKAKIFLLWILPAVIILLAVKALQTFLRIKLRDAASSAASAVQDAKERRPVIKPVTQTSSKPDFVTPVPVSRTHDNSI